MMTNLKMFQMIANLKAIKEESKVLYLPYRKAIPYYTSSMMDKMILRKDNHIYFIKPTRSIPFLEQALDSTYKSFT